MNYTENAEEKELALFDLSDYSVFFVMLLSSALIGIYFGCFGTKQKTAAEYILGGKTMKALPVGLSLVASHISGITLIGVPSEVYTDKATYWVLCLALVFSCLCSSYLFLPVFCNINITSAYEYLELRFSKSTRIFASVLFVVHCLTYLPWVIYVPSLALNQVTGINLHIISVGVTSVCVFYTMIGGLKAVVWTDFLQTMVTIVACVAILIIGTVDVGGLSYVLSVARDGGKLDIFNMDPNPFLRNTFWTVLIGSWFSWTSGIVALQGSIQRFIAVPTLRDANKVLLIYWIGLVFLVTLSVYAGILMYAVYYGCDPIDRKVVSRADQMYPYYVLDKIGYIPALPGLFLAGVFSAALSSLSAILNTLAGTVYEDYIKKKNSSEEKANMIMKSIVVIFGAFSVLMVFMAEKMGKVISVGYTISSITGAPIFSLFLLGMLVPSANTKGALTGACSGMVFLCWLAIGSTMANVRAAHEPVYPGVPNTCEHHYGDEFSMQSNITQNITDYTEDDTFILFRISFMYLFMCGTLVAVVIGLAVSYLTGSQDLSILDPKLISPPIRRFLPRKMMDDYQRQQIQLMTEMKDIVLNKD